MLTHEIKEEKVIQVPQDLLKKFRLSEASSTSIAFIMVVAGD